MQAVRNNLIITTVIWLDMYFNSDIAKSYRAMQHCSVMRLLPRVAVNTDVPYIRECGRLDESRADAMYGVVLALHLAWLIQSLHSVWNLVGLLNSMVVAVLQQPQLLQWRPHVLKNIAAPRS